MKIAILSPSDKSFIHFFLNENSKDLPQGYVGAPFIGTLIDGLLKKNHEVIAVTTTAAVGSNYEIKRFTKDNFTWIVVPSRPRSFRMNGTKVGRMVDFGSYEIRRIIQEVKAVKPDIVHAHWSYEFAAAAIQAGDPFLVTVHDNANLVYKYFKNFYRFMRLLLAEYNLKKVQFATTVSPYMEEYVRSRVNEMRVIPNPVIVSSTVDEIKYGLHSKIATLASPKIIMIINGWGILKNGRAGLRAFKKIQKILPNASLHLYGGGSEVHGLAHQDALKIGIENCFYHGTVSHDTLMLALKESHLLVHPALEESFGVVLIEAMSFGIPVIGGQHSGAVPWVINDANLLVNVKDADEISTCAIELLGNTALYYNTAIACYMNTVSRFSATEVITKYEDYYKFILNKK